MQNLGPNAYNGLSQPYTNELRSSSTWTMRTAWPGRRHLLYVYSPSGQLLYIGGAVASGQVSSVSSTGGSNIADDQLPPGTGSGGSELSSGSFSTTDPYIGTV